MISSLVGEKGLVPYDALYLLLSSNDQEQGTEYLCSSRLFYSEQVRGMRGWECARVGSAHS